MTPVLNPNENSRIYYDGEEVFDAMTPALNPNGDIWIYCGGGEVFDATTPVLNPNGDSWPVPPKAPRTRAGLSESERALISLFRRLQPLEQDELLRLAQAKAELSSFEGVVDGRGRKRLPLIGSFGLPMADRREIRREIFTRLPLTMPLRQRVRLASEGAWAGFLVYNRAFFGSNEHWDVARQRSRIRFLNAATAILRNALRDAEAVSGIVEDHLSGLPGGFLGMVDVVARGKGLTADGGRVGARVIGTLRSLAVVFEKVFKEPFRPPNKIRENVIKAASHFDLAVARALKGNLRRLPLARLIADLRVAVKLPPATPRAIEQRLRDQGIC